MPKKGKKSVRRANKPSYTPFGLEVKKRLLDIGMSQEQLEKELGMSFRYLTAIIIGRRPGPKFVPRIAEYLGIDLEKYSA